MVNKDNSRPTWKTIRSALPSKPTRCPQYTKDASTLANEFNRFFVSVASKFAELAMSHGLNNSYCPTNMIVPHAENDVFEFHPVSWAEVRKVIMALPSNKAPGYDKVPASVIKYCLE